MIQKLSGQLVVPGTKRMCSHRAPRSKVRYLSPQSPCSGPKSSKKRRCLLLGTPKMRQPALRKSCCQGWTYSGGVPHLFSGAGPVGIGQSSRGLGRSCADAGRGKQGPPAWDGPNQDLPRRLRGPQKDELKSFILQKYMMVDSAEDQKIHRPMAPKEAPKKLIRYIDNQIVSTKGERFKDVRNPEAEEMKATYINLKPARKYRFH